MATQSDEFAGIMIPTYIINLKYNPKRLLHVLSQFEDKPEFDLHIIEEFEHKIGAVGLWESIKKAIKLAIHNEDDVIIFCEDDHEFTRNYTKEYLLQNIIEANDQGCAILLGGISSFGHAIPLTANRMWVNPFQSIQFIVLYKKIFEKILAYKFRKKDAADLVLAQMTSHKMVIYPFISRQKDFGNSDFTTIRNEGSGLLQNISQKTEERLQIIQNAYLKYNSK